MKRWIIVSIILVQMLVMMSITTSSIIESRHSSILDDNHLSVDYIPHDPILIMSDSDLINQSWLGMGTKEQPYVLEGMSINGSGDLPCIKIGETSAYFEIRNCYLFGANVIDSMSPDRSAIYLARSLPTKIIDCKIEDCYYGIYCISEGSTDDSLIIGNTISSDAENINIDGRTWNFIISDNVGTGTLSVEWPRDCVISGNHFNEVVINGRETEQSSALIKNNVVAQLDVLDSTDFHVDEYIIHNNTITFRLRIRETNWCNVTYNDIFGKTLILDAHNNSFTWNIFDDEISQSDEEQDNSFDYNWYFDYQGIDADQNGIGDTPYEISDAIDMHPLMGLRGFSHNRTTSSTVSITSSSNTTSTISTTRHTEISTVDMTPDRFFEAIYVILVIGIPVLSILIVFIVIMRRR